MMGESRSLLGLQAPCSKSVGEVSTSVSSVAGGELALRMGQNMVTCKLQSRLKILRMLFQSSIATVLKFGVTKNFPI